MSLATMKQALNEANVRASALDLTGQPQAALSVLEAGFASVYQALAEEPHPTGWARVAMRLCDIRRRLPIDALDATPADQLRRRISSLLDLREVTGFSSFQEIEDLIAVTISVGAPRYNNGDARGCAALYWTTILLIAETPAIRGFAGYARVIGQMRHIADAPTPPGSMLPTEIDTFAWELRRVLDATVPAVS